MVNSPGNHPLSMKRFLTAVLLLLCLNSQAANLVPNSSFELGLRKGWVWFSSRGTTGDTSRISSEGESLSPWEVITNAGYSGTYSFRMPEAGHLLSRSIWLTNGASYKASAWLRSDATQNDDFIWGIAPSAQSASSGAASFVTNRPAVNGTWTRQSFTFVAPSNGLYVIKFSWWQNTTHSFAPQIDDVLVEPGTTLNAWAPQQTIEAGLVLTNYGGVLHSDDTRTIGLRFFNNGSSADMVYEVNAYDDYNRQLLNVNGTATCPTGISTVTINLPATNGWYRVVSRLNVPDSRDETGVTALPYASAYVAGVTTNGIIGTHTHSSPYMTRKYAQVVPWTRDLMALNHLRWGLVASASNTFTWNDAEVAKNATNGLTVFGCLHAGLDGQLPAWAVDGDGHFSIGMWTNYVRAAVARYGATGTGQIKHWEVLNEPNNYATAAAGAFNNPSNYARLLCASIQVITNTDPNAFIVGVGGVGGMGSGAGSYASNVMYYMDAQSKARMNAVSYHLYTQNGTINPNSDDRGYDHFGWFKEWQGLVISQKEAWNTESGQWWVGGMRTENALWQGTKYDLMSSPAAEVTRSTEEYRARQALDQTLKTFLRTIGFQFKRYFYYDGRLFDGDLLTSSGNSSEEWDDTIRPQFTVQAIGAWILDNGTGYGAATNSASSGLEGYWFGGRDGRAVVAAWCNDNLQRTITMGGSTAFAVYDHNGNLLQTNTAAVLLNKTPRYLVSSTIATNTLKDSFVAASVATTADTTAPYLSIDIAPTGNYDGGLHLAHWYAVDNVLVPYDGNVNQATNIVYKWKLDAGSYSAYSQSNHVWLNGLATGDHTLYVTALDTNANSVEVAYRFNSEVDTTDPTVAITSPTSSATYSTSSSTIDLAGTSSDNNAVTTVSWSNSRGGAGSCSGTTSWSKTGIMLYSGGNVITITASDAAGNSGTAQLTVTYTVPDPSSGTTNNVRNLRIGRWQSPFLGVQYLQTQNTAAQRTLMSSVPASYVSLPITYAILTGGSYGGYANGTNYYDAQYALNTNSGWNVVLQFSDMPTNLIATYVPYLVARYPAWMVVPINENDSAAESSDTIKLFRAALPSQRLGGPALYHIVNPPYIDALVASNAFQLLDSFVAHDYLAVPLNGLCTDGWWTNTYYHPSNTPTGYHPEWSVGNLPSRLAWMNGYTNQLRTNFTDTPKAILSEYGIFQNDAPDGDYAGRTFRAMNVPVFVTANYAGTNSCPYNNALYNADGVGYFTPSQRAFLNAIQE